MRNVTLTAALLALAACTEDKPKPAAPTPTPPPVIEPVRTEPMQPKVVEITLTSTSPEAVEAFKRGRTHAELGRIPEALKEFEAAVKLDAQFALAVGYLGFFNPTEEGNAMLKRAVALAEPLPPPERLLVQHLQSWREADGVSMRAQRKQLKELAPTDWRVHLLLGMGAQEDRAWPDAAAAFKEATRLNPDAVPAYNLLAYSLMNQGKFEDAIATLNTAVQKAPTEANVFDSLGEAQLRAGQFEAAEASFAKAASLSPKLWASHVGVGQSRFLRGDWAGGRKALAEAQKAAEQPGDKVQAATSVVWSYLAEGNEAGAIAAANALEKEAKALKQGLPYANAPILRAIAYIQAGKYGKAQDEVPSAINRVGQVGVQGEELARVYRKAVLWKLVSEVRSNKVKDAEATLGFLQKAVTMSISAESTSTRSMGSGMVSAAKGDTQIALQQLLECTEDDYLCRLELAAIQEKLGDAAAAEATRKKLIAANRREPEYLYARAHALQVKPAAARK